jgi:hypothetical protein
MKIALSNLQAHGERGGGYQQAPRLASRIEQQIDVTLIP